MKFTPSTKIWNNYPDKESYEWLTRGKYCYNIALKYEQGEPKKGKRKKR